MYILWLLNVLFFLQHLYFSVKHIIRICVSLPRSVRSTLVCLQLSHTYWTSCLDSGFPLLVSKLSSLLSLLVAVLFTRQKHVNPYVIIIRLIMFSPSASSIIITTTTRYYECRPEQVLRYNYASEYCQALCNYWSSYQQTRHRSSTQKAYNCYSGPSRRQESHNTVGEEEIPNAGRWTRVRVPIIRRVYCCLLYTSRCV